jgi:predicted DNA-binding protein YlxM (UPF0122 family)
MFIPVITNYTPLLTDEQSYEIVQLHFYKNFGAREIASALNIGEDLVLKVIDDYT